MASPCHPFLMKHESSLAGDAIFLAGKSFAAFSQGFELSIYLAPVLCNWCSAT